MESRLHGVPLSAAQMTTPKAAPLNDAGLSGIRAPLTVDESDFDYSVSSKSHASSYYSGSELESDGFVSGEDEFETASERPSVRDPDEGILEETQFVEEFTPSRPFVKNPYRGEVQESSSSNGRGFSRPSVKSPDGEIVRENGSAAKETYFRPFVRKADERSFNGASHGDEDDGSKPWLSESDEEIVEDDGYGLGNVGSNRPLAVIDEEVLEIEPLPVIDVRIPKLNMPIAQISGDSDAESLASELSEEDGFRGVARVPSIEVLQRVNSAPKVRILEVDEGDEYENMSETEYVEQLGDNSDVLNPKDDEKDTGLEGNVVISDTVHDKGQDAIEEVGDSSMVENEECSPLQELERNEDFIHFDDKVSSSDVGAVSVNDGDGEITYTGEEGILVYNQKMKSCDELENKSEEKSDQTFELFSSMVDGESELVVECVEFEEVSSKFSETEVLSENKEIDMSNDLVKEDSLSGIVLLDKESDQETRNEVEDKEQLPGEAEFSTFQSDLVEIEREKYSSFFKNDDQVSTDLDEELGITDCGEVINGELEEALNEEEKKSLDKIQEIRVKYLRLLHRLGCSAQNSVAEHVLHHLTAAEARPSSSHIDSARKAAMELEVQNKNDLNFSLNILVIGKTGVGKSATINSLFGERKTSIDAFNPATSNVKEMIGTINGVQVKVFDTPGLRASFIDQAMNRRILSLIKKLMQKSPPDIVLYVDRLDTQTDIFNDLPVLKSVTANLGSSIWSKSIIALTHANSVPPEGHNGYPISYEAFVTQRSQVIQELIGHLSGELNHLQLCLVENQISVKENEHRAIRNGESWRSQLLLLCCSVKILSELNSLVLAQNNPLVYKKLFGLQIRIPSLRHCLSSLLKSNVHPKLSNGDSDLDLEYSSDSDEEEDNEYDNLPPFKPLTKSQIANLSKEQKKSYFEEYDYRVELFERKQWREEMKRYRDLKKAKKNGAIRDTETGNGGNLVNTKPKMEIPPSFDGEDLSFRYPPLETLAQIPVFYPYGWDHDCGYDGVLIEDRIVIANQFPLEFAMKLRKDKEAFDILLRSSVSTEHGDRGSTMGGLDIEAIGNQLAYTIKAETKIKNFKINRTAAGVSITLLGENMIPGLKIEDRLALGKRCVLIGNVGIIDAAYGASLEARLRHKDYPFGLDESSVGLSVMKCRVGYLWNCSLKSQFSVGRSSRLTVGAGLDEKLRGKISMSSKNFDQPQLALLVFVPIVKAIFRRFFPAD